MINLAGADYADQAIRDELGAVGVQLVDHGTRIGGEVPTRYTGTLGAFVFKRLWYYWSVRGPVPLPVACELYADPVGRNDVRVAGHCGCPPPEEWASDGFVDQYHIDSAAGLRLFVSALRRHGLAPEAP